VALLTIGATQRCQAVEHDSVELQASAEPAPQLSAVLTLRACLEMFRERGFDLLIAEAGVRSAEGDRVIATAVPNPGLALSGGKNFNCANSQDCNVASYAVGIIDNFAISNLVTGKLGLRRDVAVAALEAARRGRDDAQRILESQVKQAYVQVLLSQALLLNARETLESNQRTRKLNERRFALGAINEGDLSTTQVAALEAEQGVDQAEQNERTAKVALAFLLGFRTLVPEFQVAAEELQFVLPEAVAKATPESLVDAAVAHRPDLSAQVQQEKRAETGLLLAQRNRIPDFGPSVTYSANGTGNTNISPPNVSVGLSFALPVFYLQRGEIMKAAADLAAQRVLVEKAKAQVMTDVETAYTQLVTARKLVERMQGSLLERAQKARDITRVQYEKGAASLLDLLNAQRTYTATRAEYAGAGPLRISMTWLPGGNDRRFKGGDTPRVVPSTNTSPQGAIANVTKPSVGACACASARGRAGLRGGLAASTTGGCGSTGAVTRGVSSSTTGGGTGIGLGASTTGGGDSLVIATQPVINNATTTAIATVRGVARRQSRSLSLSTTARRPVSVP